MMLMGSLARKGAITLCAVAALTMMTESAYAWRGRCWGCGAFAAGAIAGAALSTPYYPPHYYYGAPVVAPPVVYAPPPVVYTPPVVYAPYPTCPLVGPVPYYCR